MSRTQSFLAAAFALPLALGAFAAPALADPIPVRMGLICDTLEQAARVSLLAQESDLRRAVVTVNVEASKPAACAFMAVGYTDSEQTHEVRADNGVQLFRIIRITVVGLQGPDGMRRVAPVTRFVVAPGLSTGA